jgi:pyruvate dehydrogenase E1 component alpha subunit/2-oxoisovalerate dehydrogenase E1 component alpha subunit
VEKLPMVVIVANNQFAYSTPNTRQFACNDLVEKARGYGIGGFAVDGTDLLACASVITEAVRRARDGRGPQMVVAHLLRLSGHGEHDDGSYVPRENREDHYGRDCIDIATRQLIDHGLATEEEIKSWHQQFADEVQRAVAQAQQEAVPDPYHEDWSALSSRISAAHQSPNPTAQPS